MAFTFTRAIEIFDNVTKTSIDQHSRYSRVASNRYSVGISAE